MEHKHLSQSRALGRLSSKLLVILAESDKTVFTFKDARGILNTNDAATRKLLSTLIKKKWVISLSRGRYLIVPFSAGEKAEASENWYVIAKYLISPRSYYLSHYSAMELHQLMVQPISTVFISTPHRKKDAHALGAKFRFVYVSPSRIWGTEDVWATPTERVTVSDLERTILDCLNSPRLCGGIGEIAKGLFASRSEINYSKLLEYAENYGNNAVVKRLGFLLKLYGMNDDAARALRSSVNMSFALLDPSLPPSGRYWSRWRLRLNIELEELRRIVGT